jgi:peptide/nickel transport system permease protein
MNDRGWARSLRSLIRDPSTHALRKTDMKTYIARRLLSSIFVVFLVATAVFFMMRVIPGDPAAVMLSTEATPETLEILRRQMGLDLPLHIQYWEWLTAVVRLDFGESIILQQDVLGLMVQRLPTTIPLALLAMTVATLIAIPAGVASAIRRNTKSDFAISLAAFAGLSTPDFWLGILLILVFSLYLDLLPPGGYVSIFDNLGEGLKRLILPSISLGASYAAALTRMVRSGMLEVLGQDYIRTARSKGLREMAIIWRHALKNALIPAVTVMGIQIGILLGGTVVIEEIFSLPGLGSLLLTGVHRRDFPVVQACVLVIAVIFSLANLATDIVYVYLNPRIHYD